MWNTTKPRYAITGGVPEVTSKPFCQCIRLFFQLMLTTYIIEFSSTFWDFKEN